MRKEPLKIEVTSRGEVVGYLTTTEFMAWCRENGCGAHDFLPAMVVKINEWKENINEPERVRIVFNK